MLEPQALWLQASVHLGRWKALESKASVISAAIITGKKYRFIVGLPVWINIRNVKPIRELN